MQDNINKAAQELLKSKQGEKLIGKKDEIAKLANSSDGQKVKSMLERESGLKNAIDSGDIGALKDTLSKILKTDEGARIASQLNDMMKK